MQSIGLLHPGAMGSSVGAAAKKAGCNVFWVSELRSPATADRARKAGLEDAGTLNELVLCCDVIISVCPPAYAGQTAEAVAEFDFGGIYLDANAVSPDRAKMTAETVKSSGGSFVDGGIIGGPAWNPGTTRLYLAGPSAQLVADCFAGSLLDTVVLPGRVGSASALKMAYAAYTKGTTALIGAILALADHEGVGDALRQEWALSQPELAKAADDRVRRTTAKAWRFVAEMDEIAATFSGADLPPDFHRAAAEIYRRQIQFKDSADTPALAEVLASLLKS